MSWEQRPLKDVGQWYGGGTPSKSRPEFWDNGSIPWLSPKDMGPAVLVNTKDHITPAAVTGSVVRPVPANSVALVVRSGILERTLPVAMVPFETTLNQDMKAISPNDDVDARWIAWGLRAFESQLLRTTRKAGTTVASIEVPRLRAFKLPIPSLSEQRRIVEILEDHLSRLDAARDQLEQIRGRLAALRQASQEIAVAPSDESWRQLSVDHITDGDRTGIVIGPFGSNLTTRDYRAEGTPLVFVRNVRARDFALEPKFIDPNKAAELSSHRVVEGDVVITKMGDPPGDTAVYRGKPAVITADIIRLRPSLEHDPDFVALALSASSVRRQMLSITSGVAQKKVSLGRFRSTVSLSIPPLAVQRQRMETHRATCAAIDRMDAVVASSIDRSRALRGAILAAAFSGKLSGSRTGPEAI
ncbi:hypothetical protein FHJ30_05715 [Arthrobacter sp. BB-1]|uniref:restriction endonuclease subunit S n=1 Tax=unclassified Arthrobacter TaxID=235627 RepID=UPI00111198A8|nr:MULTISPECIES: restriction endonuclease subunit S [unclassified Arthrobacter]TNB74192.1 hypothetical protein FHJ30_05715 [Arthrobacter sp. BB-1]